MVENKVQSQQEMGLEIYGGTKPSDGMWDWGWELLEGFVTITIVIIIKPNVCWFLPRPVTVLSTFT